MPLIHSSKDSDRSKNIAELRHSGYPEKQAVAIGYSEQREAEKKAHEHNKYGR